MYTDHEPECAVVWSCPKYPYLEAVSIQAAGYPAASVSKPRFDAGTCAARWKIEVTTAAAGFALPLVRNKPKCISPAGQLRQYWGSMSEPAHAPGTAKPTAEAA